MEHGALAVKKFSVTGFLTIDDLSTKNIYIDGSGVMIMKELLIKDGYHYRRMVDRSVRETDHIFDEVK